MKGEEKEKGRSEGGRQRETEGAEELKYCIIKS